MAKEQLRETVKERIKKEAPKLRLSCAKAFVIAADTGLSQAVLGELCNELEVKITQCQLGCF